MGKLLKVINKNYTFYLSVKSIHLKVNNQLGQQFKIISRDGTALSGQCHLELLDNIYRRKITDTASFNEHIFSKYRLEAVSKKL